jgi:hypothetical protein
MADMAGKIQKAVADSLRPGEQVLAGTKAFPRGGVKALAVRTAAFGVLGGAIGSAISQRAGKDVAASGRNGFAVGVTDQRVLICALSGLTGSPKRLVGEIPFERIQGVEQGSAKAMAMKMTTFALNLDDGSQQAFEAPRVSIKDAEQVLAAIRARVSPGEVV